MIRQKDAQTLSSLANAGHISRESAVKAIADTFDIEDVPAELARIAQTGTPTEATDVTRRHASRTG